MTEDSQIETNIRNDGKLLRYSSNNLKKSLDLAKKISDRNLSLDTGSCDNSLIPNVIKQSSRDERDFDIYLRLIHDRIVFLGNQSIPSVIEQSASGERTVDIYSRLLRDRIIFLSGDITSDLANLIAEQLLFLEAEDPEKDIYLYINSSDSSYVNSSGGSVLEGMVIFNIMKKISPDICTICMGTTAGMGAFLLSAGTKGKRISLPSSRIMIHKALGGLRGKSAIAIALDNAIPHINVQLTNLLAEHTGQSIEKIDEDTDWDFWMSAVEAKEYGLIDAVVDRVD